MPMILDFQIQTLSAESYSLTVCERSSAQPLASATFSHRVDFLTDFSVDRLNASTKDAAERFDELQKLGRELYQKLFPPAVKQVWREYKQRSEFLILCLRFAEDAAKLEVLPWETLYDDDSKEFIAAGAKTTLTRLPLGIAPPSKLPPIPRPLKLLGFFASPLDLQDHERLNAEREQEILLEAINDPAAEGRISADFEDEAKLEILERSLKAELAGAGGYHILHFTGHGISPHDGGGLLLEDTHGKKQPASIAEVMQAIERGQNGTAKLRLAVISGCQTARTLHTGAFNDLARELLRQRVPAVIAMQFSITDEGGLKFAEVLYREIAKGVELERAVHAARRVLLEYNTGRRTDFDVNSDALAIVLLAADGACLQTAEAQRLPPQASSSTDYLGDRLDPLAYGFYGRRREYRKLRDALLHQNQRAVIIHGIGGIGKTALLTHAINRLRPRFKDVMSFDCRRAALAPETILLELHRYFAAQGMPHLQSLIGQNVPPETLAEEIAQVLMLLTERPLLIVFDNFESQLDERREFINEDLRVFLTTLMRATATGSRFLFTTRYLFDLDGERLGNVQELSLGDLSRAEALMLMQKLPNLAQAAYQDKLAVLEKFGGHPYALVTLDRHCSHHPLNQALQDASSLESKLREFLAIELNYRRLSEQARELLNRLAAFRLPVTFDGAEWAIGKKVPRSPEDLHKIEITTIPEEWKSLDSATLLEQLEPHLPERRQADDLDSVIEELIVWGLLTPIHDDKESMSLVVHDLVKDFCREQQTEETWRTRLRDVSAYCINLTRWLGKPDQNRAVVWCKMEAFELLMDAKDYAKAAPILGDAHTILARWGLGRYLEHQYQRLLGKLEQSDDAKIRHGLGIMLQERGEYDAAFKQYQRALEIFEELDDKDNIAVSEHQIGKLYWLWDRYDEALKHYQRSHTIAEEIGNQSCVASSLHNIGIIHHERGQHEEALSYYQRSKTIKEAIGDREGLVSSYGQLGALYYALNDHEAALDHFQRSLEIAKGIDDYVSIATSLQNIGIIYQDRGEYEVALNHYLSSLNITEQLGDRAGIAYLLHQIGNVYCLSQEYESALDYYQRSLKIENELGSVKGAASSLYQSGRTFIEMNRYLEAFASLLLALSAFIGLQSPSASNVANDLRRLRIKWGRSNFDAEWQDATNGELPEWLTDEPEATAP